MDQAVIVTYTGKEFDVLHPDPSLICLEDIAHALSQTCRFTGHTSKFYSVAEHSVLCSKQPDTIIYQQALLLHDAAEAYLNDIASPIKQYLPDYNDLEEVIILTIFNKYGLNLIPPWHDAIKSVDRRLLRAEIFGLMSMNSAFEHVFPESSRGEPEIPVACWHPEYAKKMFLRRAVELGLED